MDNWFAFHLKSSWKCIDNEMESYIDFNKTALLHSDQFEYWNLSTIILNQNYLWIVNSSNAIYLPESMHKSSSKLNLSK